MSDRLLRMLRAAKPVKRVVASIDFAPDELGLGFGLRGQVPGKLWLYKDRGVTFEQLIVILKAALLYVEGYHQDGAFLETVLDIDRSQSQ